MGQLSAPSGKEASYGRGLEKLVSGQPQGGLTFLKFMSVESGRNAKWNNSTAISGAEGEEKGTPGGIALPGKLKYDLTSFQLAVGLAGMCGAPVITTLTATHAWLLQFFPSRLNDFRGIWDYLFRGSTTLGATTTFGRRVSKISIEADANKRNVVSEDMSDGLGDTISGFTVASDGNGGTFAGKISSRGRRPKDSNWTSGLSLYLKVTASASGSVTFKGGYAAASPGDGTSFPAVTYNTATFTVTPQSDANNTDGYTIVRLDAGLVGMFGEDYQPYEIAVQGTDYSVFAVDDEFEIPAIAAEITEVNLVETRLSAFLCHVTLNGTRSAVFTKGTFDVMRPYKTYEASGTRYPQAIDPTGNAGLTAKFDERFFDNYYRDQYDANSRFSIYAKMANEDPLPSAPGAFEGVEIYAPQCAIVGLTGEDTIASTDTLMHTINLNAENPDSAVAGPGAHFPGTRVWQINLTTGIDPTGFFA